MLTILVRDVLDMVVGTNQAMTDRVITLQAALDQETGPGRGGLT